MDVIHTQRINIALGFRVSATELALFPYPLNTVWAEWSALPGSTISTRRSVSQTSFVPTLELVDEGISDGLK